MATVAELLVKLGYDDNAVDKGLSGLPGKISGKSVAIGSAIGTMVGQIGTRIATELPGKVFGAMTTIQDSLTPIGTLLGTGTQQFKDYSGAIKEVISNSPKSPDEIGASAYTILSAGITDTAKAQQALSDSNKLALAGLGSMPEATDLITSAMNSWKDANLSSTDAAQIFFGTIASGKTTTSQLAQGFGQIAPLAAGAGISMKELMAATAALTATGQPASVAYSGLRAAISNILKPTADAQEAAKKLGIQFDAGALKSKGLAGFIADIKQKTGGSTDALTSLFGSVEAVNAVMTLTGPQSDAFVANLDGISAAGQNLDARAKEVGDTLSNKLKIWKNEAITHLSDLGQKGFGLLETAWGKVGPTVTGVVTQVKYGISAMAAAFSDKDITSDGLVGKFEQVGVKAREIFDKIRSIDWANVFATAKDFIKPIAEAVEKFVQGGLKLFMAALDTLVNLLKDNWGTIKSVASTIRDVLATALDKAGAVMGFLSDHMEAVKAVAIPLLAVLLTYKTITAVYDGVKAATSAWKAANMALNSSLLANPAVQIALLIVGLAAAVVYCYTHFDTFRNIVDAVGHGFMAAMGFIKDAGLAVFNWIKDNWPLLVGILVGPIGVAVALIITHWDTVKAAAVAVKDWVVDRFGDMVGFITSIPGRIASYLGSIFFPLRDAATAIADFIWHRVEDIVSTLVNMPGRLAGIFVGMFDGIKEAFRSAINWIISGWNGLQFSIPKFDPLGKYGPSVGGFTIGLPDIPYLASGGRITQGGMAVVGEQGPEPVFLPAGAQVFPHSQLGAASVNHFNVTINMPPGSDGKDVVDALVKWSKRNGALPSQIKIAG